MKTRIYSSKFYPCYPIFILAYYSSETQIMLSTMSSSYSLGNIFVFGVGQKSYFANNLTYNQEFTVNFLDRNYLSAIEKCGLFSNSLCPDKTIKSGLTFDQSITINAPIIREALLTFQCKAHTIISDPKEKYLHILAEIKNRLCEDYLIENEQFKYELLDIPLYEGDQKSRIYRFMNQESIKMGHTIRTK